MNLIFLDLLFNKENLLLFVISCFNLGASTETISINISQCPYFSQVEDCHFDTLFFSPFPIHTNHNLIVTNILKIFPEMQMWVK